MTLKTVIPIAEPVESRIAPCRSETCKLWRVTRREAHSEPLAFDPFDISARFEFVDSQSQCIADDLLLLGMNTRA